MGDLSVADLVGKFKQAIQHAQGVLEENGLVISQVDLELQTALQEQISGEQPFAVVPVTISGGLMEKNVQTISLSLVPPVVPAKRKLGLGDIQDDVVSAVNAISQACREAIKSEPVFDLKTASIGMNFLFTADGKLGFGVKVAGETQSSHKVTLTLKKSKTLNK